MPVTHNDGLHEFQQVAVSQLALGSGGFVKGLKVLTASLSPALIAADTTAEEIYVVTGAPAGGIVVAVNKPTCDAGVGIVGMRVSSADHIALTWVNATALGVTPTAAEDYVFVVMEV